MIDQEIDVPYDKYLIFTEVLDRLHIKSDQHPIVESNSYIVNFIYNNVFVTIPKNKTRYK